MAHLNPFKSTVRRLALIFNGRPYFAAKRRPFSGHSTGKSTGGGKINTGYAAVSGFAAGMGMVSLALYVRPRESTRTVICEEQVTKDDRVDVSEHLTTTTRDRKQKVEAAIRKAKDCLRKKKDELGIPGMSIAVTVDGKEIWCTGIGYSDVENRVRCHSKTMMRIASISKPLTMVAVARLIEEGKLNLDAPIQDYLPSFPEKTFKGEKVSITTRQLLSHLSGIRNYDKKYMKTKDKDTVDKTSESAQSEEKGAVEVGRQDNDNKERRILRKDLSTDDESPEKPESSAIKQDKSKEKKKTRKKDEDDESEDNIPEFYIKEKYDSVTDALKLFQDDPLLHKPGTKHKYTTHGYTLISAVVEAVSKEKFIPHMKHIFKELGLHNTAPDEHECLIYNRARYYNRKKGKLVNAPYVDLSYKWAGGGFISNVHDITKFGNAMLYSYQYDNAQQGISTTKQLPGYLKPETMKAMWTAVESARASAKSEAFYGLGWSVIPEVAKHGCCWYQQFYTNHTGGAVGASSVLLILPTPPPQDKWPNGSNNTRTSNTPQGVVVAIFANLQGVSMRLLALEIAQLFEEATRD